MFNNEAVAGFQLFLVVGFVSGSAARPGQTFPDQDIYISFHGPE
jgi:hypothetical protein